MITLSGKDLIELLDFISPDRESDPEQLETEVSGIKIGKTFASGEGGVRTPAVTSSLTEATKNVLAAAPALMDEKFSFGRSDWFDRGELPPVGVECEFRHPVFGWTGCDIVGHYRLSAVCAPNGGQFYGGAVGDFRPIRAERDLAIDEMKRHFPHHGSWDTVGRIYAEALYDAGYRKETK